MTQDLTIRELQTNLPWTVHYSGDFRANPQPHKDFSHALIHVLKAAGALAALVDDMDHRKETADQPDIRENTKYLADLVICAMRAANTFPGGVVDLQRAVEDRLETKNNVRLPRSTYRDLRPVTNDEVRMATQAFMVSEGLNRELGTKHIRAALRSIGIPLETDQTRRIDDVLDKRVERQNRQAGLTR